MSVLVTMSGLPGVGKSSIARSVAKSNGLFLVELDHLEGPLLKQGIRGDDLGWSVYDMIATLAEDNLALGHSVLLDAVGWTNDVRARWADVAERNSAEFRPIEVICSDMAVHRERVLARKRNIPGYPETTWESVEAAITMYEPWSRDRLIVDTVRPLDDLISEATEYARNTPRSF